MKFIAKNIHLAVLLAVVALAGCFGRSDTAIPMVQKQYDPQGRKMLIVPFNDMISDYFESKIGSYVADYAGFYIQSQRITPVMLERNFPAGTEDVYKKNADNTANAWRELAKTLKCDLVLIGQIENLPDLSKNSKKLEMQLSAQLLDMKQGGKVVWQMDHVKVVYPEEWEISKTDQGEFVGSVPVSELKPRQMKMRLIEKAGATVAKNFHDHPEPGSEQ